MTYADFVRARAHGAIPDRGYCLGAPPYIRRGGWLYDSCYLDKGDAHAAAKLLANECRESVDVVQVQNRGNDRFIIARVKPDGREGG